MNTSALEITGTWPLLSRGEWAPAPSAGTGARAIVSYPRFHGGGQPAAMDGNLLTFWEGVAVEDWNIEMVSLSQRTPWRRIFGAGFYLEPASAQAAPPSIWPAMVVHTAPAVAPLTEVEMLGRIRHALSLNTSELATVMGVGRPTIYAWMGGGPMRNGNRERLLAIYRVSQLWWQRRPQPLGEYLYLTNADGRSVLDLLQGEAIDAAQFEPFFKVAINRLVRVEKEKSERAPSYTELQAKHSFAPTSPAARERTLRQFNPRGAKPQ